MPTIEKIKFVFAFPLAFLVGVVVMALMQLFQVGGLYMTLIVGGGLLLLFVSDYIFGRTGQSIIMRFMANFDDDPKATLARLDAAEAQEAQTSVPTRMLQITGFVAGCAVCLIWSPAEVIDWVERRPFL